MQKIKKRGRKEEARRGTIELLRGHWSRYSTRIVISCCLLSFIGYSAYYFHKVEFDDTALLGGDEWEYQAIAVNFVKGHGFPVFGMTETFQSYKMQRAWSQDWFNYYYNEFINYKVDYRFYRTPAYPYFLGIIYKLFGISPKIAKEIQLLLLIVVASLIPLVGFAHWGLGGFLSGLVSSSLFMTKYYSISSDLMAEPLMIFTLLALLISFVMYERKKNIVTSSLLGLILGLTPLVKGTLIFIPPLFLVYLVYQVVKKKSKIISVAPAILVFLITVSSWSIYASHKSHQTIIFSTQGDVTLIDGNNEAHFQDGGWHPEVRNDAKSFYGKDEIKHLPATSKLIRFYAEHYDKIPRVIYNKLKTGLDGFVYLKVALLLIIFELFTIVISHFIEKGALKGDSRGPLHFIMALIGSLIGIFLFDIVILLLLCIALITMTALIKRIDSISLPISFLILFLNVLLITITMFGFPRFVYIIDFLFMLTAIRYAFVAVKALLPLGFTPGNRRLVSP